MATPEPEQPVHRKQAPGTTRWQAVGPYLDRALEMEAGERAAWIAALRVEQPSLAADLEALLEEHRELNDEGFLEGRAVGLPAQPGVAGQTVGPYTLVAPVGYGGMGTVWLAERSDGRFERRAAVKFLNLALLGRGEARFRREGRILGRLTHPHIAQLLDAGVTTGGQAYLVLEHVDGESIDRYCDSHGLDVDARIRLVLDVLGAVAHAHANLVVHRDIKPSNVLVDGDGQVKLLDFGIAWLLEDDSLGRANTMLTQEGAGPFTPEYAAPEQLTGQPITTATDVYALGVLLYVLLTGQHPAGTSLSSPAALVRAVTDVEPPRPSDIVSRRTTTPEILAIRAASRGTTPDRLHRALRGDLDRIVGKALRKRPQNRYVSVTALAEDLRRYLAHEPVSARPDTIAYRAGKFVRRNRLAVGLGVAALLATIAGAAGTFIQARTARIERDYAVHELSRAEAINDLDRFILSDAAPSGKPFTVNELLKRAEGIVSRQRDEASRVELLISIGYQYMTQDQDASARRVLEEAYRRSRALSDLSIRGRASCTLASALGYSGELPRAEALFQEGLRELPNASLFGVDRAFCFMRGTAISREAGRPAEAIARVRAAEALLNASPFHSDIRTLGVLMQLAECYRNAGRAREADETFERASRLLTALGRDDTQEAGTLFNNWALVLQQLGRPRDAEGMFRRAIDISSAGAGEQGVSPMLLVNEARALRDVGRLPEAADYVERGFDGARKAGNLPAMNQALLLEVAVYRMQGDLARAAATLAEVEPRLRRALPPGHIAFAAVLREQGLLAQRRGDFERAVTAANEAIALVEASLRAGGQGREALPVLLVQRSDAEREMGRLQPATADAARAVQLLLPDVPRGSWSSLLGAAYLALARARTRAGEGREAAAAGQAAFSHLNGTLGGDHPDTQAARELAGLVLARQ